MAAINTGLGGPQGVGEGSVRGSPLTTGNYDDGALRLNITSVFGPSGINYFGTNYTSIFINTNGLITFNSAVTSYTPTALSALTYPAIAVFWSDVNITSGTANGTNNIYYDLDPASGRVTITWLGVRPYSGSGTNTFQLVLEHTGNGNFEIDFIYQQVQWTNGFAGVAQTGMTNGGAIDYVIPGSGNAAALTNFPNAVLDPNDPNGIWSTRFLNGNPVCFVAGTQIATPTGPRAVESLKAGDWVETLDDGPQPLIWAGGGSVIAADAARPVCISAGVLGNDADLWVSGQHLMLLSGADCELLFGEAEVLVAAKHLLGLAGVFQAVGVCKVSYHHLLLSRHQLVIANGTAAETLFPGPQVIEALPHRAATDLTKILQADARITHLHATAARRILTAHEARVLLARRPAQHAIPPAMSRPARFCA
jgi:hypothetical protein